jgi:hypothetical protein
MNYERREAKGYSGAFLNKRTEEFKKMSQKTYQLNLNFDQILDLVKQLPESDKIQLSKELEKETLNQKLTQFLETFKTDELSLETITEEVEIVRTALHEQQSAD